VKKPLLIAVLAVALDGSAVAQTRSPSNDKDPYPNEKVIWDQLRQAQGIREFVARLHRISSVSNIDYEPMLLLTTCPARQWVSFDLRQRHYRFLLSDSVSEHRQVVVVWQQRSEQPR
jgi:hypothetical protein